MVTLKPLGDRAFLAQCESEAEAQAWASALRQRAGIPVVDLVVSYRSVAVFVDPDRIDPSIVATELAKLEPLVSGGIGVECRRRLIELPVLYDGEDLAEVAGYRGLTVDQAIAAHGGQDYTVYAIGFFPGFPYAGYLPESLSGLPRRAEPRVRVPAGSVAIAGRQTGVYPSESPGGWHLIGRTPLRIVDLDAAYFPIVPGDLMRFVSISSAKFDSLRGLLLRSDKPAGRWKS